MTERSDGDGQVYGFVGLGNMGGPMAANIGKAGFPLVVYDIARAPEDAPRGAAFARSIEDLAARATDVFLSLPGRDEVLGVNADLLVPAERRVETIIDLSTIGIEAAREAHRQCAQAGVDYIDSPVSGGRSGAIEGTIAVMWAGPAHLLERHRPALEAIARNVFHVGEAAGQGQAMKLLNNFLSATATAATAEAMLFGLAQGLDFTTMLQVVNVSTGQSRASSDKFVNRVLTGTFDSGFATALMAKDVALYAGSVRGTGTAHRIGDVMEALWREAQEAMPRSDHTEIFKFLKKTR